MQIIDKFIDAFKDANPEDLKETPHNLYLELIAHLISILPMLKDKSFEDEKEIRVYFIDGKFISDPATNSPPFIFLLRLKII
ncbi:hypothetical protein [Legionella feeleii]|uniref:Uncharacterized protein n=1 Tax=Legionella feeleii TaxID=453 RepID=A0A378IQX2_9GAMM|nr:hypothetical protein [Legionella feeleii]STX37483.1 Uncharacterised protein [Legionella feeleii]